MRGDPVKTKKKLGVELGVANEPAEKDARLEKHQKNWTEKDPGEKEKGDEKQNDPTREVGKGKTIHLDVKCEIERNEKKSNGAGENGGAATEDFYETRHA